MARERTRLNNPFGQDYRIVVSNAKVCFGAICLILFLLISTTVTTAATFSGRFSSDFYGYTAGDQDHLQSYIGLRAYSRLWSGQSKQELSFHTYSRWTSDLIDKLDRDPEFSVYSAYFRFDKMIPKSRLQLGRQFVYNSAGSGLIDGGRITITTLPNSELDLFAGSSVIRTDPESVNSFSDEGVLGARFSYLFRKQFKSSLLWFYRKYAGETDRNRVGYDLSIRLQEIQAYGRITYDIETRRLAEYLARLSYANRSWYVAAEWLTRDPSVPAHSIYSLIDYDRYNQSRIELRRRVRNNLWLVSNLTVTYYESKDDAASFRVGLQSSLFAVGWNHQNGYSGERDGLYGNIYYKLSRSVSLYSRIDMSRYQIQNEVDDRSDAYAAVAGLQWRYKLYEARVEGQYLRNAVNEDDARIRFSFSRGFSLGE